MKKTTKLLLSVCVLTLALTFVLSACNPNVKFTFDSKGGSAVQSTEMNVGTLAAPTAPTKENYDFKGWYFQPDCSGAEYKFDQLPEVKEGEDGVTLYAKWQVKEFTLVFNSNGGEDGNVTSKKVPFGEKISDMLTSAAGEIPTRTGHTFAGWRDGDGNQLSNDLTMTGSGLTVYAAWLKNKYKLNLDPNGGTAGEKTYIEVYYGDSIENALESLTTEDIPTPETGKDDKFDGWRYNDAAIGDKKMPAEDITLTAAWLPKGTIEFTATDADLVIDCPEIRVAKGESVYDAIKDTVPKNPENRLFAGWTTDLKSTNGKFVFEKDIADKGVEILDEQSTLSMDEEGLSVYAVYYGDPDAIVEVGYYSYKESKIIYLVGGDRLILPEFVADDGITFDNYYLAKDNANTTAYPYSDVNAEFVIKHVVGKTDMRKDYYRVFANCFTGNISDYTFNQPNLTEIADGLKTKTELMLPSVIPGASSGANGYFVAWIGRGSTSQPFVTANLLGARSYPFKDNTALKKVTLPLALGFINYQAFIGATGLEEVVATNCAYDIVVNAEAFKGCTSLDKLTKMKFLAIGTGAFEDCSVLTDVNFGGNLSAIYNDAFKNSGLTDVTLPATVGMVNADAFGEGVNVTFLNEQGEHRVINNGGEYSADGKTLLRQYVFPGRFDSSDIAPLTLKDDVEIIGKHAFETRKYQKLYSTNTDSLWGYAKFSVTLPETVTKIDDYAFCETTCYDNKSTAQVGGLVITLNEGLTEIGVSALYTQSLVDVRLPSTLNKIADYAFNKLTDTGTIMNSRNLNLTVADNIALTEVGKFAVSSDSSVTFNKYDSTSVTANTVFNFPNLVKVGEGAFVNFGRMVTLQTNSAAEYGDKPFPTEIVTFNSVETGIVDIADWNNVPDWFAGCGATKILIKSDAVVAEGAFSGCKSLTTVGSESTLAGTADIAGTTVASSDLLFMNTAIVKALVPDSFVIGKSTFQNCLSLVQVGNVENAVNIAAYGFTVPASGTNGGAKNAFTNCEKITKVILGGEKVLPDEMFRGCYSLKSVGPENTPDGTVDYSAFTSVGTYAVGFGQNAAAKVNSAVTDIKLNAELAELPANMCYYLSKLTTVYSSTRTEGVADLTALTKLTSVKGSAFAYCASLAKVALPVSVATIAGSSFSNDALLNAISTDVTTFQDGVIDLSGIADKEGATTLTLASNPFVKLTKIKKLFLPQDTLMETLSGTASYQAFTQLNSEEDGTFDLTGIKAKSNTSVPSLASQAKMKKLIVDGNTIAKLPSLSSCNALKEIILTGEKALTYATVPAGVSYILVPDKLFTSYSGTWTNSAVKDKLRPSGSALYAETKDAILGMTFDNPEMTFAAANNVFTVSGKLQYVAQAPAAAGFGDTVHHFIGLKMMLPKTVTDADTFEITVTGNRSNVYGKEALDGDKSFLYLLLDGGTREYTIKMVLNGKESSATVINDTLLSAEISAEQTMTAFGAELSNSALTGTFDKGTFKAKGTLGYIPSLPAAAGFASDIHHVLTLKLAFKCITESDTFVLEIQGKDGTNTYGKEALDGANYVNLVLNGNTAEYFITVTINGVEEQLKIENAATLEEPYTL